MKRSKGEESRKEAREEKSKASKDEESSTHARVRRRAREAEQKSDSWAPGISRGENLVSAEKERTDAVACEMGDL